MCQKFEFLEVPLKFLNKLRNNEKKSHKNWNTHASMSTFYKTDIGLKIGEQRKELK